MTLNIISDKALPISVFLPQVYRALQIENNLILQAEPGAGKSTALPLSLLDAHWLSGKKIIMLEPRRLAAKSIAHYLASQLNEKIGQRVGYQIKNDRKISKNTQLQIVTEGILTRRLQNDPELADVGLIIFDEFHERSVNGDLCLMLCLEVQQTIRDDLKLLVMSATIDSQMISKYMDNAQVIKCPGRSFPVTVRHTAPSKERLENKVLAAISGALASSKSGDVLVFLPGRADIKRSIVAARLALTKTPELVLIPLYAGLSLAEQEQALTPDPNGKRRIIFSTNIAETSLTIQGITCVVDSGLQKVLVYDPRSGMTRLETTYISQASATQRAGRAGRTQAGECMRLWDEDKHRTLKAFQGEEILCADLSTVLLELYLWGANHYETANWLTAPPKAHYESAKKTLLLLGMINIDNQLTPLGQQFSAIPVSPRLSAMLFKAQGAQERGIACELAALLSDRDIFKQNINIDIIERLLAVQDYKLDPQSALRNLALKRSGVEQLLASANQYRRALKWHQGTDAYSLVKLQQTAGKLLLYAYPDRLAKRRGKDSGRYHLANGKGVFLYEDDPLYGCEWLVVAQADAQKKEGRIYSATSITVECIWQCFAEQLETRDQFEFDPHKQKIIGQKLTVYGSLTLRSTSLSNIPPTVFNKCLIEGLQSKGLTLLNWTSRCEALVARVQWLAKQIDDIPKMSKVTLLETLDHWLIPYLRGINTLAAVKKINVLELLLATLSWDQQQLLEREAPTEFITPGNKRVALIYDHQQGPMVSVQLQEMFGQIESPMIGGGKVAIRFELLSPARRPIQTTSDLANFWHTSYFDVARDMRSQYPKHRWPEQPLLEKAGRSIKIK